MALMKFREPNQVKWQGSRPAHNGTQFYGRGYQAGVGDEIVYTVPVGKTAFLTYCYLTYRMGAAQATYALMASYTDGAVLDRYILNYFVNSISTGTTSTPLTYPIEIPENYTIRVITDNVNLGVEGVAWGWIE